MADGQYIHTILYTHTIANADTSHTDSLKLSAIKNEVKTGSQTIRIFFFM